MPHSQKISSFTVQPLLDDSDLFTLVRNGQNLNVTFASIKADLGVTGSISQTGSPLGTPVLENVAPNTFKIRNLESGPGVLTELSPQNGIKLSWSVNQDGTGVPITSGLTNNTPVLSSILPGPGIQVTKVGDVITVTATGVALPATQAISINQESDFPAASGGVITLEPNTAYIISNTFATSNRLVLSSGTTLVSFGKEGPMLTYTGTGTMLTSVDVSCVINNFHYDCPNGKAHDHSDTTGNNEIINISNSRLESCVDYGDFTSLGFAVIFNSDCFTNTDKGPLFSGTGWKLISINRFALTTLSATYVGVDLNSAISDVIELDDLIVSGPTGSVGVTGLTNSGNITSGNLATIINCNFPGDITPITNIEPVTDLRWRSIGNDGIGDSRDDSLISIQGNSDVTTIAASDTPVQMAGTWTNVSSSRFVVTLIGGRMTFIGELPMRLPISATVSIKVETGGDKQVSAYIAINGTVVPDTKIITTSSSSKAGTVVLLWQHNFVTNDYVEIFLANEDDGVNLIGQSAVARVD